MPENKPKNGRKKIALAHDFLLAWGGAERMFKVLAEAYPDAPIYTLLADPAFVGKYFPGREIRTSFLQKFPAWLRRRHRWLLPLYAIAVEAIDLRDFPLVISSSGAWMKGLVTRLHTRHIAYLHSPMRYVWDSQEQYLRELGRERNLLLRIFLSYLRVWDRQSAERPDTLLVNSEFTRRRVEKYYRRDSTVVYPPAGILQEQQSAEVGAETAKEYFLIVARLTRSKRVDTAIEAFNRLELPLLVVGTGPEEQSLRELAGPTIQFAGALSDTALAHAYAKARAIIQPSEEDFGLVVAEALSFGIPTIALSSGAATELIEPGVTGELFMGSTPEMIADGVRRFLEREKGYQPEIMRQRLVRYGSAGFLAGIRAAVDQSAAVKR
ncbi:MAG: glycosyltransferase [Candidatus Moraniibacteriota bacterium]|nr:MAG: glycosyltransferase [Candidatus Moranbacteria bacterium]